MTAFPVVRIEGSVAPPRPPDGCCDRVLLRVAGKPRGKARARVLGAGAAFTPQATVSAEQRIGMEWIAAGRPRLPDGPVGLKVTLHEDRPKSHYRRDGQLTAEGQRHRWPVRKPDVDNCLKLVMDSLNGLAYRDDAQIVHATVERCWTVTPGEHTQIVLVALREAL